MKLTEAEFEAALAELSKIVCHSPGCTNFKHGNGYHYCRKHTHGSDVELPPIIAELKLACDEHRKVKAA